MAVPPKFAGQLLTFSSGSSSGTDSTAPHTLEFYLDYVCPFSAKQYLTFTRDVIPLIKESYSKTPGVRIIFRQQIQPWHPSSTLVHEAGVAVLRLAPSRFYEFSTKLFEQQKEYFDESLVNESRNETYKRLAKLAGGIEGIDEKEVFDLLVISDKTGKDGASNSGNKVTNDIKFIVKANRLTGVHVSPTVLFNGVEEKSMSSSWTKDQWAEWLEKNLK